MAISGIAALLAVGVALVAAQPQATHVRIQPAQDNVEERKQLRTLSACVAAARSTWARDTLAQPYLSEAQVRNAERVLTGRDRCLARREVELQFRTSTVVAALAEHYLRTGLGRADLNRLVRAIETIEPLNASEDFALCLAAPNPNAARNLALSDPGTAAEEQAAATLARGIKACTNPGEQLNVDVQSLRALASIALYRALMTTPAGVN